MKAVERYQKIQEQVVRATDRVDRDRASVRLMVVSKAWKAEDIEPIADAGHLVYGENRVLEAIEKISLLPSQLEWHLIGHLQKNKVRKALPAFHTIHSVDSLELARRIDQIALDLGLKSRVLLQVNIGNEPQKNGFSVSEVSSQIPTILALERLNVVGLMAIPPQVETAEQARPYFRNLRLLRDRLESEHGCALPELSMGMTSDFEVAIEEGSTIVRVGSAIFGSRH
ncbi:YggS family pyridoxal phosphate-dependent enzyme [Verrucomicrobiales bacterium]|jgi:pyridoxal phosphate enzyme (YggS family)|nr:YggS family pyridoxal phosphate-dependent enzyme [Verrucomicrobiales bacterium]MDB4467686.1 YggS family pyridoxal phosphate-dependent enzyme [Verrucomicrobiales bacterium]